MESEMILSCGEALIDMLPRITTLGEPAFSPYAGGAVFNTAIALGRLGAPSAFYSGISTDMLGEILTDTLAASKVNTDLCTRSNRPTTVAFVKLVNGQATYAFYDENTAGGLLAQSELPTLPADISTLFFGGISLVNDPAASTYETLQTREAADRVIMIDPNIRLGFIAGKEAQYRARINRMIARSDIVKLSDEDLHWFAGTGDLQHLANDILAMGAKVVFVTEGAKGAWAFTARDARFVASKKVTVADTVGAGDTFNAGVLTALYECGALTKARIAALTAVELDAALELGARAAAVTVSRAGANPPWSNEL
jgi:fructokinase